MTNFKKIFLEYQRESVEITLLDNPFVKKWSNHLDRMLAKHKFQVNSGKFPYHLRDERGMLVEHAMKLNNAVKSLIDMGTGFPEDFDISEINEVVDKADDVGNDINLSLQLKLNRLHRYFTTCEDSVATTWTKDKQYPVTGLKDRDRVETILKLSHDINVEVHNIEKYIITPNKKLFLESPLREEISITFDIYQDHLSHDQTSKIREEGIWESLTFEDYIHLSDDPVYDVWLPDNILGKPYNIAFYDHDDPREWDITHNIGYTGAFSIGVRGNKASEMQNDILKNWLKSYGVKPTPATCGMPAGKVTQGKDVLEKWYDIALSPIDEHFVIKLL